MGPAFRAAFTPGHPRSPPPSCGTCPAPVSAMQRRAPPGSGALWRGSRGALGGTEEPCAQWGGCRWGMLGRAPPAGRRQKSIGQMKPLFTQSHLPASAHPLPSWTITTSAWCFPEQTSTTPRFLRNCGIRGRRRSGGMASCCRRTVSEAARRLEAFATVMAWLTSLHQRARQRKAETWALYLAACDPRTPWYAKLLVAGIVAYACSPIDLIPDFIPVLGYLDDLVLLPLGIAWAVRLVGVI